MIFFSKIPRGIKVNVPWPTAAFLSGLVGSLLSTRLVQEIQWGHRWHAVALELLATGVGILALQIWAARNHDWLVLAIEGVGVSLGTLLVLSL